MMTAATTINRALLSLFVCISTAAAAQAYSPYAGGGVGPAKSDAPKAAPPQSASTQQPGASTTNNAAAGGAGVRVTDTDKSKAFEAIRQTASPLTPEQTRELIQTLDAVEREKSKFRPQPTPLIRSVTVDPSPGVAPPVIRLSDGNETTIVFLDGNGSPWPIRAWRNGDDRAFSVVNPFAGDNAGTANGQTNMLNIGLKESSYPTGSLTVFMSGIASPITFRLLARQPEVDYRIDVRLPGRSPTATPSTIANTTGAAVAPELLDVLSLLPPNGARVVKTREAGVMVWELNGAYLVRMPHRMISPAWVAQQSSADGMNAYRIPATPIIVASRDGQLIKIEVAE
jgi:intracellular multiplication protein IcmK